MTFTNNQTGTQTNNLQASDIKNLVQRQGKATIRNTEFSLKSPAPTDHNLQEIIKNPTFSVKTVSGPTTNGECEYELSANGKSVKIKVDCKTSK